MKRRADQGGFVLAFVVFMLFAVSIAATTGYLVVSSEFSMAKHATDGAEALTVARAGLERFVAEQIGVVDDTVSYALGDGVVEVTSRKVFQQDSVTDIYYVRAEATVTDIFAPNSPARRVVAAYATHRKRPLAHHATVVTSAANVYATSGGTAHGFDYNSAGDCPGGGASQITGAIARSAVLEASPTDIQGSPQGEIWPGGYTEVLDSIGLRWDVLSDPDFPVEFDGVWPSFGALPADSFPIIRQTGWTYTNVVGRGVLIVDGTFDPGSTFEWDGIILARDADDLIQGEIRGLLVAGLDANNFYPSVFLHTNVHYYSCNVYAANETLSYLELVENSIFEAR